MTNYYLDLRVTLQDCHVPSNAIAPCRIKKSEVDTNVSTKAGLGAVANNRHILGGFLFQVFQAECC